MKQQAASGMSDLNLDWNNSISVTLLLLILPSADLSLTPENRQNPRILILVVYNGVSLLCRHIILYVETK